MKRNNYITNQRDLLNTYFKKMYAYMASGLILSGIVAFISSNIPAIAVLFANPFSILIAFIAQIAIIFMIQNSVEKEDVQKSKTLFFVFSALEGLVFSAIFVALSFSSIFVAFITAASLFIVMAMLGYFTSLDLSGMFPILLSATFAIIIAGLLNLFIGGTVFSLIISIISILVFAGWTAYDNQKMKELFLKSNSSNYSEALTVSGALELYLDFINLFISILRLFNRD